MPVTLPMRQSGLTLIELMIAITISLLVLAALTAMFVTSSRARDEITRANEQIENGRYAMQVLTDDLKLAGYFAEYVPPDPTGIPEPCDTALPNLVTEALHVQGYDTNGTTQVTIPALCTANIPDLTDRQPGTDIILVRRVSSCTAGSANCAIVANAPYFQASNCNEEIAAGPGNNQAYRLGVGVQTGLSGHNTLTTRHMRFCHNPTTPAADITAPNRRFLTHIYFVDEDNVEGDGIPTLKRAELGTDGVGLAFTVVSIAEGIEDMQFMYGVDGGDDGAAPDNYQSLPGNAADWRNTTAVEVHLLARGKSRSPGHVDSKTYQLGPKTITPAMIPNDQKGFKRHVFRSLVQLNNPAGRRQE